MDRIDSATNGVHNRHNFAIEIYHLSYPESIPGSREPGSGFFLKGSFIL